MRKCKMANEKKPVVKAVVKTDKLKAAKLKSDKAKPAAKKGRKIDLKKSALSIGRFFREVVAELRKVSWPSRKEFVSYTIAVVVFVAIFGAVIFIMDIPLSWSMSLFGAIGQ
jgi:preprotein translocase SecE subunit